MLVLRRELAAPESLADPGPGLADEGVEIAGGLGERDPVEERAARSIVKVEGRREGAVILGDLAAHDHVGAGRSVEAHQERGAEHGIARIEPARLEHRHPRVRVGDADAVADAELLGQELRERRREALSPRLAPAAPRARNSDTINNGCGATTMTGGSRVADFAR